MQTIYVGAKITVYANYNCFAKYILRGTNLKLHSKSINNTIWYCMALSCILFFVLKKYKQKFVTIQLCKYNIAWTKNSIES